ncbi:hypothetical protein Tco_1449350 [Tanacetum coccineum]
MEAAVEQCSVDRKCCEIQQKQFLIENDRLLDKIISQDIVNIVLNSSVVICDYEKKNDNFGVICNKFLELEAELVTKNDENVDYQSSGRLCNLSFLEYLKLYFFMYEQVAMNLSRHGLDVASIEKHACLGRIQKNLFNRVSHLH